MPAPPRRRDPRGARREAAEPPATPAGGASAGAGASANGPVAAAGREATKPLAAQADEQRRALGSAAAAATPAAHGAALVTGLQARCGLAVVLVATAALLLFGQPETLGNVAARCLYGEAIVQVCLGLFMRYDTPLLTPLHVMLSFTATGVVFFVWPLDRLTLEAAVVLAAVIALPTGAYYLLHGVLVSQLSYHLSTTYWTFEFETAAAQTSAGNTSFALTHQSPISVIAALRATQLMVQLLEIGGLDHLERRVLTQARNHFLYRVRNSASLRHKAIATELLFRVVAELVMKRTAMRMAEPGVGTISFMERQFLSRLVDQCEVVIRPLPYPLDPDSPFKWVLFTAAGLVSHKRLFRSVKTAQGGRLDPSLQTLKYLSRFGLLVYMSGRFLISQARQADQQQHQQQHQSEARRDALPRMFN